VADDLRADLDELLAQASDHGSAAFPPDCNSSSALQSAW